MSLNKHQTNRVKDMQINNQLKRKNIKHQHYLIIDSSGDPMSSFTRSLISLSAFLNHHLETEIQLVLSFHKWKGCKKKERDKHTPSLPALLVLLDV